MSRKQKVPICCCGIQMRCKADPCCCAAAAVLAIVTLSTCNTVAQNCGGKRAFGADPKMLYSVHHPKGLSTNCDGLSSINSWAPSQNSLALHKMFVAWWLCMFAEQVTQKLELGLWCHSFFTCSYKTIFAVLHRASMYMRSLRRAFLPLLG